MYHTKINLRLPGFRTEPTKVTVALNHRVPLETMYVDNKQVSYHLSLFVQIHMHSITGNFCMLMLYVIVANIQFKDVGRGEPGRGEPGRGRRSFSVFNSRKSLSR